MIVISEYGGTVPVYTLKENGSSWSDVIYRTHSLSFYSLSADRKMWDKKTTVNLNLTGKILPSMFWEGLQPIRPFSNDVAFLTFDE